MILPNTPPAVPLQEGYLMQKVKENLNILRLISARIESIIKPRSLFNRIGGGCKYEKSDDTAVSVCGDACHDRLR